MARTGRFRKPITVFISYRRLPSALLANLLEVELKNYGVKAFVDSRRQDGGGPFPEQLLQAIQVNEFFVCLLAKDTFQSDWVRREIEHAYKLGKVMIPVFQESFERVEQPPSAAAAHLLQFQGVHIFDQQNILIQESIENLAKLIQRTRKKTQSPLWRLIYAGLATLIVVTCLVGSLVLANAIGSGRFSPGSNDSVTGTPATSTPSATAADASPTSITVVTIAPSITPLPTTSGVNSTAVTGRVTTDSLNIRTGPGTVYNTIGQLLQGDQVILVGRNQAGTWYVINFQATQGWINGNSAYLSVSGNPNALPVIVAPPTPISPTVITNPTVPPTITPFVPSAIPVFTGPDIQFLGASLTPSTLVNGQPFTLSVTVSNSGDQAAGQFAIAASFNPGSVYGATLVQGLAAGQATTVDISFGGVSGSSGNYSATIVLDLNNQVAEGSGESNNNVPINYNVQ